jgi:hypothetical protein
LADDAPERDVDARRLFGIDFKTNATRDLAVSAFLLGDGEYARRLMDRSVRKAWELGRDATIACVGQGQNLFQRDPTNPAAAEEASNCAQRCHWQNSTNRPGRPAEAHAILPPAVEGFSPTT